MSFSMAHLRWGSSYIYFGNLIVGIFDYTQNICYVSPPPDTFVGTSDTLIWRKNGHILRTRLSVA